MQHAFSFGSISSVSIQESGPIFQNRLDLYSRLRSARVIFCPSLQPLRSYFPCHSYRWTPLHSIFNALVQCCSFFFLPLLFLCLYVHFSSQIIWMQLTSALGNLYNFTYINRMWWSGVKNKNGEKTIVQFDAVQLVVVGSIRIYVYLFIHVAVAALCLEYTTNTRFLHTQNPLISNTYDWNMNIWQSFLGIHFSLFKSTTISFLPMKWHYLHSLHSCMLHHPFQLSVIRRHHCHRCRRSRHQYPERQGRKEWAKDAPRASSICSFCVAWICLPSTLPRFDVYAWRKP